MPGKRHILLIIILIERDIMTLMDKEFKDFLSGLQQDMEKLARAMATGFSDVQQRFDEVNQRIDDTNLRIDDMNQRIDDTNVRISDLAKELRDEIKSLRLELGQLPDEVYRTYSKTINDLLERVTVAEKRLAKLEASHA